MALGINLRLARDLIASDAEAAGLLDASLEELNEATRELRELARGIHPAALTERGLQTALNGLALRSPVPVELVETPAERLPTSVDQRCTSSSPRRLRTRRGTPKRDRSR